MGNGPAAHLYGVDTRLFQQVSHSRHLLRRKPALDKILGVHLYQLGVPCADRTPDGMQRLENDASPILDAAAVAIRSPVEIGGEKLTQEIAMRSMDLDPVETGFLGPCGALPERSHAPACKFREIVGQPVRGRAVPFGQSKPGGRKDEPVCQRLGFVFNSFKLAHSILQLFLQFIHFF